MRIIKAIKFIFNGEMTLVSPDEDRVTEKDIDELMTPEILSGILTDMLNKEIGGDGNAKVEVTDKEVIYDEETE